MELHAHTHSQEDEGLPSVLSAISRSTPQLGPSLQTPAPTPITPPEAYGGYMEGNGWRFLTRQGPSRAGLLYMMRPLYKAAGLTAVTHTNLATVTGSHVAGPATQMRHLF